MQNIFRVHIPPGELHKSTVSPVFVAQVLLDLSLVGLEWKLKVDCGGRAKTGLLP